MPAVPFRVRVSLVAASSGQLGITSFHVRIADGVAREPSFENMEALATAYDAALADPFKECLAQEATYLGLRARLEQGVPVDDLEVKTDANAGFGAWTTANSAPTQICGLLRKRTLRTGRHGRGRCYIPFVPADAVGIDGNPTGGYLTALQLLGTAMLQNREVVMDGVGTTFRTVVVAADRAAQFYVCEDITRAGAFATQRRRGAFGRLNPAIL